jgi:hypothetical protein
MGAVIRAAAIALAEAAARSFLVTCVIVVFLSCRHGFAQFGQPMGISRTPPYGSLAMLGKR